MADATMRCHLCPEVTAIDGIVDHVRLMHPDHYEGKPVVVEELMHPDVYEATPFMFVEERVLHRFPWRTA